MQIPVIGILFMCTQVYPVVALNRPAPLECLNTTRGYEYKGNLSKTASGKTCQAWASQEPHGHSCRSNNDRSNYCTNVDIDSPCRDAKPWCYTTDPRKRFELCDIPMCEAPKECRDTIRGYEYKGLQSKTASGRICQSWSSQNPHRHSCRSNNGRHNYCSNAVRSSWCRDAKPWCYTTDPLKRWEFCDIPMCEASAPKECRETTRGYEYRGHQSITASGRTCQAWASQTPHRHSCRSNNGRQNYCSNCNVDTPCRDLKPWCYTTDPKKRWEFCDIPKCEGVVWRNHALKGIASQMSTLGENTAVRGVDGNADNIIAHNSCSVTHNENNPWWMVTFHNVIQVIEVAIASAQNDEQLTHFDITIGPFLGKYGKCGSAYNNIKTGETTFFTCPGGPPGPTMKITKYGSGKHLTLCEVFVYGSDTHITRALKGIASQISTLREYKAQLAMDGNADNILAHNSCSVTDNETDPWWMVTFGDIVRFYGVEIVSADNDEKSSRFDISIGPYHGQYGTCGSSYNDETGETGDTMFFKCPRNVLGPTLKITKSGSRTRLTLCEVFVYGHVIRQIHVHEGIASQISTLGENKAERAVDGNADNIYAHNSCSTTHKETNPWWMFTFNYVILFSDVAIVSADNGEQLSRFNITIGPRDGQYKTCGLTAYNYMTIGETKYFKCPWHTYGSNLRITKYGNGVDLTLCEVFAYGQVVERNLATEGTASQSSTRLSNTAVQANDGNADGILKHRSCSMTKADKDPWWMVTFKNVVLVETVMITNRGDCCGDKLKMFYISVGPYKGRHRQCGSGYNSMGTGETRSFTCPSDSFGSILKIAQYGRGESLTLCEVMIYGRAYEKYRNLALDGMATQSSTFRESRAERATDGNADGIFAHNSCSMTENEHDPWWMITFNNNILVYTVDIANRADCCGEQHFDITIVLHGSENKVYQQKCGPDHSMRTGEINSFVCVNNSIAATGREVVIRKLGSAGNLTLCEVFVFGKVYGACKSSPCKHGGICKTTGSGYQCICSDNYSGRDCENCVGELKEIRNQRHSDGELRSDAKTLKSCQEICMERVEHCAAIDFQNGVCRVHYKANYHHNRLFEKNGNNHYRVVPTKGNICPE